VREKERERGQRKRVSFFLEYWVTPSFSNAKVTHLHLTLSENAAAGMRPFIEIFPSFLLFPASPSLVRFVHIPNTTLLLWG